MKERCSRQKPAICNFQQHEKNFILGFESLKRKVAPLPSSHTCYLCYCHVVLHIIVLKKASRTNIKFRLKTSVVQ